MPKPRTSFAHLATSAIGSARKADDDEDMKREEAKRAEEEDAKAEDDDMKAESDDAGEDAKAKPKSRKARKARKAEDDSEDEDEADDEEGDDESDREEMRASATSAIRARERARCAAIFGAPAAASNPALAAELAFGTALSRSEAVRVLDAAGTSSRHAGSSSLDKRMASVEQPALGRDAPAGRGTDAASVARGILEAAERARPLRRA